MPMPDAEPRRRRLPGAHDDAPFRVFMITTFWLAIVGVLLLFFVHWIAGAILLALCLVAFLGALLFAG